MKRLIWCAIVVVSLTWLMGAAKDVRHKRPSFTISGTTDTAADSFLLDTTIRAFESKGLQTLYLEVTVNGPDTGSAALGRGVSDSILIIIGYKFGSQTIWPDTVGAGTANDTIIVRKDFAVGDTLLGDTVLIRVVITDTFHDTLALLMSYDVATNIMGF